MKNLVLNNHHPQDQDKRFAKFLETHFTENQEIWDHFEDAFWAENEKETIKRFSSLKTGDNILCHTVFVDYQQLELMILLLYGFVEKGIKINVYISCYQLVEELNDCFNEYESSICPDTKEYDDDYELRRKFKKDINEKMLKSLDFHNIYELNEIYFDHEKPSEIRSTDMILEEEN